MCADYTTCDQAAHLPFSLALAFSTPTPTPPPPKKKEQKEKEKERKEEREEKKKERLIAGFRDLEINSKPSIIHFGDLHI